MTELVYKLEDLDKLKMLLQKAFNCLELLTFNNFSI